MRSERARSGHERPRRARRLLAALAGACLMTLAVACSGSPARPGHPAGASAAAGNAAATRVPAPAVARGTLTTRLADAAYSGAIVPSYPLALRLADTLANHPAAVGTQITVFTAGLSKSLASMAEVVAFPAAANDAFTAYRAQARALLTSLAQPASVTGSQAARQRSAQQLYAFARQIGMLGVALGLVPTTESGGKH